MLTFSSDCLNLIKHLAISKQDHAVCVKVNVPVEITGYETITGSNGKIRVETLNPYGYFWCTDYIMPNNYLGMSWDCVTTSASWGGGDRTCVEKYKERLLFSVSETNKVSLVRETLKELGKEIHGKKSFMGGWVE